MSNRTEFIEGKMIQKRKNVLFMILISNMCLTGLLRSDMGLYRRIDLSSNPVVGCRMTIGDLDGDGMIDFLFNDGRRVIKAFDHYGNLLWEKINLNDPGVEQPFHNYSLSIYDIDLDSENEVLCYLEIDGNNCLAVVDGSSGNIETSVVVPFLAPRDHPKFGSDNYYMLNHTAIANLRGLSVPQDILAIHSSKQKVAAYSYINGSLVQQWFWITDTDSYASGHFSYPYDIDSDGRDEVIAGVDVLDENGIRLWRMPLYPFSPTNPQWGMDHPDAVCCTDLDLNHPGKEIIVVAATGMWMFTPEGDVLWHYPSKKTDPNHGIFDGSGIQEVLVGNFRSDIDGFEIVGYSENMSGPNTVGMFDAIGNSILWENQSNGPKRLLTYPMDWDGDRNYDEIYSRKGIYDGNFNRIDYSMNWSYVQTSDGDNEFPPIVADLQGDHREEIIWYDGDEIIIIYNSSPLDGEILPSPWTNLHYRLRYANDNSCNAYFFDWSILRQVQPDLIPPNKPANLRNPHQTESTIQLEWEAPIPASDGDVASFYRIFRNNLLIASPSTTSYNDTGLLANNHYSYKIFSVDDNDNQSVNGEEGVFKTSTTYYPDVIIDEELFAKVATGTQYTLSNEKRIPILLYTSKQVLNIPSPLVLKESDASLTYITLQGEIPGQIFSGNLILTEEVADGPGFFELEQNALLGLSGIFGDSEIAHGDSITIDKTPPFDPTIAQIQTF